MFFNRKKEADTEDNEGNYSKNFSYPVEGTDVDEDFIENEKRRAFYNALSGKTLNQLLDDLSNWINQRILHRYTNSNDRILVLQKEIRELENKIRGKLQKVKDAESFKGRYLMEIHQLKEELGTLDEKFEKLVNELGEAHQNLITTRIAQAEEELTKLVEMYKNVYKKKYEGEENFTGSLKSRRDLVDELIKAKKKQSEIIEEKLLNFYKIGSSKLSTTFLTAVGLLSSIAAGYYFSAFSNSDTFTNQNWLFFGLSNLFNYLFLYVDQFGPLDAVKGMLINFIVLLAIISAIIWLSQYFLQKTTNDRSRIEFGLSSEKKRISLFKLQISSRSALSFWFQLLPWIFVVGLGFIMITVGQYIGTEKDQIGELEKRLSGQIIGTTISLICTAICYLYITKIVEQRKLKENSESDKMEIRKRKNRELILLALGVNVLLGILIINQLLGSHIPNSNMIFSVLCFILLLNLTAFTLSYGLIQKGLLRSSQEIESKIKYLHNLKIALSGSTPIRLWIREANKFDKSFLAIRKDIDDLSRIKSYSLAQLKNPRRLFGIKRWNDPLVVYSAERFASKDKSRKNEIQFFYRNFPNLSTKISKIKSEINGTKQKLGAAELRLNNLHEGRSDFQNRLNEEIKDHELEITELQKTSLKIKENTNRFAQKMEEEKRKLELYLMEGFELGIWSKDRLEEQPDGQLIDVSIKQKEDE